MKRDGWVELQGRWYPQYQTILAEAHARGIESIVAELVQIPGAHNENTAIVRATVRMKDGSVFTDYGDASPRNVNSKIAAALIRMASTRAKGRALRDACNVGETLVEELSDPSGDVQPQTEIRRGTDTDTGAARPGSQASRADVAQASRADVAQAASDGEKLCAKCGTAVSAGMATYCASNGLPVTHPRCR